MGTELDWEHLSELADRSGLDRIGVCRVTSWTATRGVLERRRQAGLAADMSFTYRNPARSTEPSRLLGAPQSLLVAAVGVPPVEDPRAGASSADRPLGHVARYAATDAFDRLQAGLRSIVEALLAAGHRARVMVDDNGLVDREAAFRAGLGWYGKNSLLLIPGLGSNVVLGSVVTSAYLERVGTPLADGCGGCTKCLDHCPTEAIVGPGVVDASRCLSWLLQSPKTFPEDFRAALGARLYGCDDCQEVCPPSRVADRRSGRPAQPGTRDVLDLLRCADDELMARCGRWYIPGRDPDVVRRNLLIVAGNTATANDVAARIVLEGYAQRRGSPLAEYAEWALEQIDTRASGRPARRAVALTSRGDEDGEP